MTNVKNTDKIYSIEELKAQLEPIFKKFQVRHAAVFGSYARGESVAGCDVDLMVKTHETFDLDKYYAFEEEMAKALGVKVDVTFEDYINPFMKETILMEAVNLYED